MTIEKNKERETILEKISIAVNIKRRGDFDSANEMYVDLDNKHPNNPTILKSWAKTLVCLGEYDTAINKYQSAIKHYNEQGNDGESWQCTDQVSIIKDRFNNPDEFKEFVRAVSGGSITDPNI